MIIQVCDVIRNSTFHHRGYGNVQHWITSELGNNKNYSVSVTVGESEANSYFGKPSFKALNIADQLYNMYIQCVN